jgi:hypothetical protein
MLLKSGANPNFALADGTTPLHIAVREKRDREKEGKRGRENRKEERQMGGAKIPQKRRRGKKETRNRTFWYSGADILSFFLSFFQSQKGHARVVKALCDGGADPSAAAKTDGT